MLTRIALVCGLLFCFVAHAVGQTKSGPTPAKLAPQANETLAPIVAPAAKLLAAAHGRSREAHTLDHFSSIVEDCERALGQRSPPQTGTYAKQLAAWAYNRRGEVYAEQAAGLANEGEQRQANELDALALDDFQAAVRLDAGKWKALHNRGVSLALHGQFDAALGDFAKVIELKPDNVNTWFNRGEVQARLDRLAEAKADYSHALKLKPDDIDAVLGRGAVEQRSQNSRAALADFNQALKLQPNHSVALCARGDAHVSLGQWQAAADDYRRAIKLSPKLGAAYRGAAWLMATCPEEPLRNEQLALESARKALELSGSDNIANLDTLAAAEANAGQYEAARATLAKAIELSPPSKLAPLQARLELYSASQPYRESASATQAGNAQANR